MQLGYSLWMFGIPKFRRVAGRQAALEQVAPYCAICEQPRALRK
jgi:hypothetical protein